MSNHIGIREASLYLGVAQSTLRRWESEGKLIPDMRTKGGQRRYKLETLSPHIKHKKAGARKTLAYARVSSPDQKADLKRQERLLEMYCAAQGWSFELISDLGSGINYRKKGLKRLISQIIENEAGRLVITHKDRLLRFGSELVFAMCEAKNVEVVIINQGETTTTLEEDLAKDVLELITVFSARLYGAISHKNKKLLEKLEKAVNE